MNDIKRLVLLENEDTEINDDSNYMVGLGVSTFSHLLILLVSFLLSKNFTAPPSSNFESLQFIVESVSSPVENIDHSKMEQKENESIDEKKNSDGEKEPTDDFAATFSSNLLNADTSSLQQFYSENTLNVRVRYPLGWKYVDQNVKSKLDGVTFFGSGNSSSPPPYIHIEVKEKYLFNPNRFLFNVKMNDYVAYFNEPTVLEEQYSQILYLRTDSDEDYSIKLIVIGKEKFFEYQKVFFTMVKSFKFGGFF